MVGEISSILRELEKVQDQLSALSADAHSEKMGLLARHEELQTAAAKLAVGVDKSRSTQDLLAQLASLRRQNTALERQRGNRHERTRVTRPMADPMPNSRIEQRICDIESILRERGISLR